MADFGLDPVLGFNLKRLSDIQASMQDSLSQVTDPITGETLDPNFQEDNPFIQEMNSFVDELTEVWEALQGVYEQWQPSKATGASLSGLVQINALTRKSGTPSSVVIKVFGDDTTVVPIGFTVSDAENENQWITTEEFVIGSTTPGEVDANFVCTVNGRVSADPYTIDTIVTTTAGIESVENQSSPALGTGNESDEQLRARRAISTTAAARSIPDAIAAAINDIDGVTNARVFVNRTLIIDSRGIPAKSIGAVVTGGDDETIARAIFHRLGLTTATVGNVSFEFTDLQGETTSISFVRPTEVPITVEVDKDIVDQTTYDLAGGDEAMKEAIVNYALEGIVGLGVEGGDSGFTFNGFNAGDDVAYGRLFTATNSIAGQNTKEIRISRDAGTPSEVDVEILWNEIASFSAPNITIFEV